MLTDDQAWAAVLARDPAADSELVYAVTTTGVFCRPTCPSRRPMRDNVRFFTDPAAAATAGFRPCQRCRPQQRHADAELVEKLMARLHSERPVTLSELARSAGRSPFTVERLFKRVLGVTPAQYQRQARAGCDLRRGLFGAGARV
jgi:AraC family transcriptional regulator of adaptative response/methylated-DNA-[protein]-cysteine methyltransferase